MCGYCLRDDGTHPVGCPGFNPMPESLEPGWDPFRPGREMQAEDEQAHWEDDPEYRALYGLD